MSRHAATAAAADLASQYRAATTGAVVAERPDLGRVLFAGRDAADLLHRLSTNAVTGLAPGGGTATVLTTNKGRILDLVTLHRIDAGLLALGAAARMPGLVQWIDRYTFREQVTAADWGASHRTLGLYGPAAAAHAARLWGEDAASLPLHHVLRVDAGGAGAWLVRTFALGGGGFLVTAEAEAWSTVRALLFGGGRAAASPDTAPAGDVIEIGPECLEVLRVLAGLPAYPGELNEEHNPWEARLHDAIALDKGCYIGQEVIARLDTYKKVARWLVRISIAGGTPAAGAEVRAGSEVIGALTSAVAIPDGSGRSAALAYVRERDAVAGGAVSISAGEASLAATIEGVAR